MKRGGPLRRTQPLKRGRKRLRPVSAKRRARTEDRIACRNAVMHRCGGACEACPRLHTGPRRSAVDVHEIVTRARGGSIYDPDNCLGVCRICYRWIGDHPHEAGQLGLVAHAWDRAS